MNSNAIVTAVMSRIARRRAVTARISAGIHGLFSLAAIAALVPAYQYAAGSAAASGFSAYVSLAFSDTSALAHSWQAFLLTLAESAPIAGGIALVAVLLVLAYSARGMFGDIARMQAGDAGGGRLTAHA